MMNEDVQAELEKLRLKRVDIANRLNVIDGFEEKEDLRRGLEQIQKQIKLLESLVKSDERNLN